MYRISVHPLSSLTCLQPIEDKSMESLKTIDTNPIDLYDCFKAFVREDQLGEEECWSVHAIGTCSILRSMSACVWDRQSL